MASGSDPGVPRATGVSEGPVSFAQEGRLRVTRVDGLAVHPENVVTAIALAGHVDRAAAQLAVQQLIERHPTLRTRYLFRNEGWLQRFENPESAKVIFETASNEREGLDLIEAIARLPFPAETPCQLALAVIHLPTHDLLALIVDHLAVDYFAMATLLRDFSALYDAAVLGAGADLPMLPITFIDYVLWERQSLEAGAFDGTISFWQDELKDVAGPGTAPFPTLIPLDERVGEVDSERVSLGRELSDRLRTSIRRRRVTWFMAMLAAVSAATRERTGTTDLLYVNYFANRGVAGTADLVGWLATTLFIRVNVSNTAGPSDLLNCVRSATVRALENSALAIGALQPYLPPAFQSLRPRQATVSVSVYEPSPGLEAPGAASAFSDLQPRMLDVGVHAVGRGRLDMQLDVSRPELELVCEFEAGRFARDTVRGLLDSTAAYLTGLIALRDDR